MLAFPGEELPSLVAISFLEIAAHGRSSANSVIIPGVGGGVLSVAEIFFVILSHICLSPPFMCAFHVSIVKSYVICKFLVEMSWYS